MHEVHIADEATAGAVRHRHPELLAALDRFQTTDGSTEAMLALARQLGSCTPRYGAGATVRRWEWLATIAAEDVSAARVVEAHLDALAILAEAADASAIDPARPGRLAVSDASTWGVFAAEAHGIKVEASSQSGNGWRLSGVKPWCSLAGQLTHALVTAHTDSGRRLFAVALRDGTVSPTDQRWVATGLQQVPSTSVRFDQTPAVPVGPDQWYLDREGFAWGGAGVAACWFGGAVGVARHLFAAGAAKAPDQIAEMHLGAVDAVLTGARSALLVAADQIDRRQATGAAGAVMALRVRSIAADAVEHVLRRSAHALGPAPLALEEPHARRVADLQLYIRQHHAERDLATLGRTLRSRGTPW